MLKIDFYIGVEQDATTRMLFQGHFLKWYQEITAHVDTRLISLPNGNGLNERVKRKFFDMTGFPLVFNRRRNSLLHIASVNLVNNAISSVVTLPLVVSCFDAIVYEDNIEELAIRRPERTVAAHEKILRKADRIITVSGHARSRIADVFGLSREKIDVAYNGVDHTVFYPGQIEKTPEMLMKYGFSPDRKNILYVGSETPRKNLERMIRALPLVGKQSRIQFVKVGKPEKLYHSALRDLVRKLGIEEMVHFRGIVSAEDLPIMYNLADVFVFPSLYEGFGLPPLEAMACGCPVVTSNITSLPEVVGDAAVVVDPYDIRNIADGILSILNNEEYRQELIRAGRAQALKFDWRKAADIILNAYRKVMS